MKTISIQYLAHSAVYYISFPAAKYRKTVCTFYLSGSRSPSPSIARLLLQLLPYSSFYQRSLPPCPHVPHLPLANITNHIFSSTHSLAADLPHPYQPHCRWSLHQTEPNLLNLETDTIQSHKYFHLYTTHRAPSSSNTAHCQPHWPFSKPAEAQQGSAAHAVPHLTHAMCLQFPTWEEGTWDTSSCEARLKAGHVLLMARMTSSEVWRWIRWQHQVFVWNCLV